jgi:hypothetical protein
MSGFAAASARKRGSFDGNIAGQFIDTSENWQNRNPTLEPGQLGIEYDTGKVKWGDGQTAWNSLAYQLASSSAEETLANKTLESPELTGAPYVNGSYRGNVVPVAALNIDCNLGNYFIKTIAANSTFTVSNVPSDCVYGFTLKITHTSGDLNWFSGVEWPAETPPVLTTGKTHLFVFVTDDGGTKWRGAALVDYAS